MTTHVPVLPSECLELLQIRPGYTVVDATFGAGGHSRLILEAIGHSGRLLAFDRDPAAVEAGRSWLPDNASLICANYADIPEHLASLAVEAVHAMLLDLGLSSDQLADRERGFSFHSEGPLDLRFNPQQGEPAWRLVNRLQEKHLADLIFEFGEERFSRRIARKICESRHRQPIKTAQQLAALIRTCVPKSAHQRIDPATRTFQALRIAINQELKWLTVAVRRLPRLLTPSGRIAVISFHSLEDRIVKLAFHDDPQLQMVSKRPVVPCEGEKLSNPRSRCAKLRVAERLLEPN